MPLCLSYASHMARWAARPPGKYKGFRHDRLLLPLLNKWPEHGNSQSRSKTPNAHGLVSFDASGSTGIQPRHDRQWGDARVEGSPGLEGTGQRG